MIAHPRQEWVNQARDLSGLEPVRRMLEGESGVLTFRSPAIEMDVIAGFTVAPNAGWGVMVPQPLRELVAKADQIWRSSILVFLMGLGLSAIFALTVSGAIARGLGGVSFAARRMAEQEPEVEAPTYALQSPIIEVRELSERFNDMAEKVDAARDEATLTAAIDPLTELLNRAAFVSHGRRITETEGAAPNGVTLYFIDIDHFKAVNDAYGHAFGDELLRHFANMLRQISGPNDLIGRHSGDELLLLRVREPGEDDRAFGKTLLSTLCAPTVILAHHFRASCSVGACAVTCGELSFARLLTRADKAMYRAKRRGRGRLCFFDLALERAHERTRRRVTDLSAAIAEGAIRPAFHPIFAAASTELVGFEALARWEGADGASVGPARRSGRFPRPWR